MPLVNMRGGTIPSIKYAKRIADALGVSLDYLANEEDKEEAIDHETVSRVKEIQKMPEGEKNKILSVLDALTRDFKTRQAYA